MSKPYKWLKPGVRVRLATDAEEVDAKVISLPFRLRECWLVTVETLGSGSLYRLPDQYEITCQALDSQRPKEESP